MAWQFKREEPDFPQIPEGSYRIRIKSADKAISKSGNDMLTLQFDVSGYNQVLYHYIVFLDDRPEITNRMLTQFFDSFAGIKEGDFDMSHWIGQAGACKIKHDEYDGKPRARISYFIKAEKAQELPPWKDATGRLVDDGDGFMSVGGEVDDLPFV